MTTRHRYTLAAAITATLLFRVSACTADDFSERFVAAHNVWRSKVGVAPLKWSGELAAFAQSWANHLKKTNACDMQHRSGGERNLNGKVTGENLAWTWQDPKPEKGFIYTPEEAVDAWGNEVKYYDLATGKCKGGVCGHYTQLVWHNTTDVGCGRASCGNAEVWVCNYLPAGNFIGRKPY